VDCFMSPRYLATIKAASGSSYNDAIASRTSTITLPSSSVELRSQFSHTHYPFSLFLCVSPPPAIPTKPNTSCVPLILWRREKSSERKAVKKTGLWLFWSTASSSETERNYTSAFLSIMECFALCLCGFCHWNQGLFLWKIHR
jgi:hypothetical protein